MDFYHFPNEYFFALLQFRRVSGKLGFTFVWWIGMSDLQGVATDEM
jgi:hypothetical protein